MSRTERASKAVVIDVDVQLANGVTVPGILLIQEIPEGVLSLTWDEIEQQLVADQVKIVNPPITITQSDLRS